MKSDLISITRPGSSDRSKYTNLFKIKVFVNNVQTKTAGTVPGQTDT